MPKRLAITISGAVSLGSYEAGVLYEVLRALGAHNENPATTPAERIEIDVLTGASAGGMTAAIAAQVLLGGADRVASASDNAFHSPWVKEVDLAGLLKVDPEDPPGLSILSSAFVQRIAERHLTDAVNGRRHPACAAGGVKLGLAMSNLNGVDLVRPTHSATGPSTFAYTRFQDEFLWRLPAEADWPAVRQAALACGAFPLAFRAREIARLLRFFKFADPAAFVPDPRPMTYVDGGVFQNEPIGLAKAFVDEIDEHRNVDSRFFLFVAPGMKTGVGKPTGEISAGKETLLKTVKHLARAVFWQARFQDWIMAESISSDVHLLNRRAAGLAEALLARPTLAAEMASPLSALLALFYSDPVQLAEAVELLREQFASLTDATGRRRDYAAELGATRAEIWLKGILLLERAAGLEGKDEMTIYTITAENNELGGDPLFAFAGFIDESIRQHDYDVGRKKAREWLASGAGGIFPIRYTPTEALPAVPDKKISNWEIGQFDLKKRKLLAERFRERADLILQEAGLGGTLRWAVKTFYLNGKIDKLLGL